MSPANSASNPSLQALLSERAWLVRLAGRLVASATDAEDLVQETLTRAIESNAPGRLSDGGIARPRVVRAWLNTTARNIVRERWRLGSTRRAREAETARAEAQPSNVEALARAELREAIARHVLDLPDAERLALVLKFFEGLSGPQIASRLGLSSAGTARQRVSRGVAMLRDRLDRESGDRARWFGVAASLAGVEVLPASGTASTTTNDASSTLRPAARSIARTAWLVAGVVVCAATAGLAAWSMERRAPERAAPQGNALAPLGDALAAAGSEPSASAPRAATGRTGAHAKPAAADAPTALAVALPQTIRVVVPDAGARGAGTDGAGIPYVLGDTGALDQVGEVVINHDFAAYVPICEGLTLPGGAISLRSGIERSAYRNDAFGGTPLLALMTRRTDHYARAAFPLELTSRERAEGSELELPLSAGATVTGRVVDPQGEPLAATLWLESIEGGFGRAEHTRADGSFELRHIADLPRSFVVGENGEPLPSRILPTTIGFTRRDSEFVDHYSERVVRHVRVEGRTLVDIDDVVLWPPQEVVGYVTDSFGNRVAGAAVSSRNTSQDERGIYMDPYELRSASERRRGREVRTDAEGRFSVTVARRSEKDKTARLLVVHPNGAAATRDIHLDQREDEIEVVLPVGDALTIALRDAETGEPIEEPRADFTEGVSYRVRRGLGSDRWHRRRYLPLRSGGLVTISPSQVPRGSSMELLLAGYEPIQVEFDGGQQRIEVDLDRAPILELQLDVRDALGARATEVDVRWQSVDATVLAVPRGTRIVDDELRWVGPGDAKLRVPIHGGESVVLLTGGTWRQGRHPPKGQSFGPLTKDSGLRKIEVQLGPYSLFPRHRTKGPWDPDAPNPAAR